MRVALSGAAGFVAGYVAGELQKRGHEVRGIDNFSKYGPVARDYELVEGDCKDPALMARVLDGCDHFIACAAMIGGIEYFHKLPYDLLAENERITAAACDAAIAAHRDGCLRKVTWLSSSMVFERAEIFPSAEGSELEIPPPASSYGFSKLAVEYFARAAREQHGLPYSILRPFNCVGTGEGPYMSHVVPDLIRKVLAGQDPLVILGDGNQVRHYTYGGDLARGICDSLEHPGTVNEDFNLSSPVSTTVLELAGMIWARLRPGDPFRWVSDKPFRHDVRCRVPDVSKAKRILGFEAATALPEMLNEVIASVRLEMGGS